VKVHKLRPPKLLAVLKAVWPVKRRAGFCFCLHYCPAGCSWGK